jgi:RHS repeat-associated protein
VNIHAPAPQARGATGIPVNRQSLASRRAFFSSFFALAIVFAMSLGFSSHAHAQTGYWTYGTSGMCGGTYCSSAMAACEQYRANDVGSPTAVITGFTPDPRLNEYFACTVTGPIDGTAGIYLYCPGGYQPDLTNPSGCSVVPINPKVLGPQCLYDPQMSLIPTQPQMSTTPSCSTDVLFNGTDFGGDPVEITSGNMAYKHTDYTTSGQNPLQFVRYYNSKGISYLPLGTNWQTNFSTSMFAQTGTALQLYRADGKILNFAPTGSVWHTDSDIPITGTVSGTVWSFTDQDGTTDKYSYNQFISRTFRNGYTQTMHYTGSNLTSVTDSYGRTLTFTYNADNSLATLVTPDGTTITYGYTASSGGKNLTSVTYPTSPSTSLTYVYGSPTLYNALTEVIDENGNNFLSWTYDSQARALTSTVGNGANAETTTFSYGSGTTTVTNALGVTDTYTLTSLNNMQKITGISRAATATTAAATESFSYDTNGFMSSKTDWNGNQTTYVNNAYGLPTTVNEAVSSPVARTTTIAYDATWVRQPDTITTPGLTTGFTYDSNGNTLTRTLTDTTTTSIPYSTNGQTRTWTNTWSSFLLASTKTPNNNTTSFGYSSAGALTSITNPLSQVTNITSSTGGGYPETIVDPNSVTTTLSYNPRQWLTSSVISGTGGTFTTSYSYDSAGNLAQTTLPDSSYIANTFDTAHRLTKVTDALGNYIAYTLDAFGDRTQSNIYNSSSTLQRAHSGTFDALGRILTDVGGVSGETTTFTYDKNGNALTVKDGDGNTTTRVFDALNRPSTSTDASSGVASWAYDAHNRPLTFTDPNSNATAFVYDGFGDAIQQASPDTGTTVYHYDSDANLTQKVNAASVTMNATYDALDRILTRAFPADATQNATYTYDTSYDSSGFPVGRLATRSDASGFYSYDYDERGNTLNAKAWSTPGGIDLTALYGYDNASRLNSVSYPSGLNVGYLRDSGGNITSVSVTPPGAGSATFASVTNAPFGPPTAVNFGNSINTSVTLDQDYRITNITASGTATVENQTYALDNASNLTTVTDAVNAANSQTLGYDVLNRLTSAVSGTGGYGTLAWGYDHNGNLTSRTAGGTSYTYSYTSGTNQLAGVTWPSNSETLGYTATGNINSETLNSSTVFTGTYNVANRLTAVANVTTPASFVYNDWGLRFSKTDSGGTPSYYTYGQDGALLEENNNGAMVDYIYLHGKPIGLFVPGGTSGTLYYVNTDQLGTPQVITNGSQAVVWSTTYQPYGTTGTITSSITQNLRLPGQYYDSETTLNYNGMRDYVPTWGRYLQSDPIGLQAGLNTYAYVGGNPLKFRDTLGLIGSSQVVTGWDDINSLGKYVPVHEYFPPQGDGWNSGQANAWGQTGALGGFGLGGFAAWGWYDAGCLGIPAEFESLLWLLGPEGPWIPRVIVTLGGVGGGVIGGVGGYLAGGNGMLPQGVPIYSPPKEPFD